jgi:cation:H+ antiporter
VLVTRLERIGERLGLSEALLGIAAALAADAPEITAAVTALAHHEHQTGAGVVLGSNVFNLAALLGLGAVVAGRIGLHRRVIALAGSVAVSLAAACLAMVTGLISPAAGAALTLGAVLAYLASLVVRPRAGWLAQAVAEEEQELSDAIRPARGTPADAAVAATALAVVVAASAVMERAASSIGTRLGVPEIITGGLVLAAVTSLPNAIAAVYLAARGRGHAALSTALNSNAMNVVLGLMLPAAAVGVGPPSAPATLVTAWYAGLTLAVLVTAYAGRGLTRRSGMAIIAGYLVLVATVLALA